MASGQLCCGDYFRELFCDVTVIVRASLAVVQCATVHSCLCIFVQLDSVTCWRAHGFFLRFRTGELICVGRHFQYTLLHTLRFRGCPFVKVFILVKYDRADYQG